MPPEFGLLSRRTAARLSQTQEYPDCIVLIVRQRQIYLGPARTQAACEQSSALNCRTGISFRIDGERKYAVGWRGERKRIANYSG